jgi:hypothetical protein
MKAVEFEKGSGRNGIGSHFCLIANRLNGVKIAAMRFYCSCLGCKVNCHYQLQHTMWVHLMNATISLSLKSMMQPDGMMSSFPMNDCNEDEPQETMVATLKELGKTTSKNVVIGGGLVVILAGALFYATVTFSFS